MNKITYNLHKLFMVVLFLLPLSLMACNPKVQQNGDNPPSKKSAEIIYVTTDYMQKHIYDFRKYPNEFVYKGDKPAIIDFYADWCGPCRMLSPKLKKMAEKYGDQIVIYKINVDEEPVLSAHFNVRSIPMLLFVPLEGKPYQSLGNMTSRQIEKSIEKILPAKKSE